MVPIYKIIDKYKSVMSETKLIFINIHLINPFYLLHTLANVFSSEQQTQNYSEIAECK